MNESISDLEAQIRTFEEQLKMLSAEERALGVRRKAIEASLAAYRFAVADLKNDSLEVGSESDPFLGMTQSEMAAESIRRAGRPLTPGEILKDWERFDRAPKGNKRTYQVLVALRKRAKSPGDVFQTESGRWGLDKELHAEVSATPDVKDDGWDPEEQSARVVEGMRKAQKKGTYFGAPPRITPEQWALAIEMVAAGETLRDVHRRIEADLSPGDNKAPSYQTIHNYSSKIKAGEPYPKNWAAYYANLEGKKEDIATQLRVVK
jgi:hypothetical protein